MPAINVTKICRQAYWQGLSAANVPQWCKKYDRKWRNREKNGNLSMGTLEGEQSLVQQRSYPHLEPMPRSIETRMTIYQWSLKDSEEPSLRSSLWPLFETLLYLEGWSQVD